MTAAVLKSDYYIPFPEVAPSDSYGEASPDWLNTTFEAATTTAAFIQTVRQQMLPASSINIRTRGGCFL